jgi:hypothetical protein
MADNLEKYIGENAHKGDGNSNKPPTPNKNTGDNLGGGKDLNYTNIDLSSLPMGDYYKDGTKIKIRAASVGEIQSFAVVDDKNFIDITEKMNLVLSACIRLSFSDGSIGSYKDIKDGDRMYLIFQIRELTFQQGPALSKKVDCESCNHEFSMIYRTTKSQQYPKTIFSHDRPEKLEKYYDKTDKCYVFKIPNSKGTKVEYRLSPPVIGVQECFFTDIRTKVEENQKRNPNVSQMKLLQFMLWDRNYISPEGIKEKEDEIKNYDMKTFQILNSAVNILSEGGIKDLEQKCPNCGVEVHSELTFPDGASSIFVVSDFFKEFDR